MNRYKVIMKGVPDPVYVEGEAIDTVNGELYVSIFAKDSNSNGAVESVAVFAAGEWSCVVKVS